MAYDPPAKNFGDTIKSADWNGVNTEVKRLDSVKLNLTGGALTGNLSTTGTLSATGDISTNGAKLSSTGDISTATNGKVSAKDISSSGTITANHIQASGTISVTGTGSIALPNNSVTVSKLEGYVTPSSGYHTVTLTASGNHTYAIAYNYTPATSLPRVHSFMVFPFSTTQGAKFGWTVEYNTIAITGGSTHNSQHEVKFTNYSNIAIEIKYKIYAVLAPA